jgi:uncharacterized lipoprotein YajG
MSIAEYSKVLLRALALTLFAVIATGCVAGQSIKIDHEPEEVALEKKTISVSVKVDDARSFVRSGDEPSNYIGQYRAGFGNPWNVTTESGRPLADLFADDIEEELVNLGFAIGQNDADKQLRVKIAEWNFDSYINAEIWYEVYVRALDARGAELAESRQQQRLEIPGSFWVGPKYAVQKRLPEIYAELIDSMVRGNPDIMDALMAP